jgi:hypothetical protein
MASPTLIRWGGLAATVGWLMWVMKGGSILLRGLRPPLVLEAALPVSPVGLLGVHARLGGRGGP